MTKTPIKRVVIHFENDDTAEIDIPDSQGFYRERYTFEQEEINIGGKVSERLGRKLYVYELFWTLREDQLDGAFGQNSESIKP